MAKLSGNKNQQKVKKTSSGLKKTRRINRQIMRLQMKINRWKKNQKQIQSGERKGSSSRWDTSGLEKHLKLLESFV